MDDYTRARAQKLAQAGYAAVVFDTYGHGKVAGLPKDATAFMATALAEPKLMSARFAAARAVLANQAMVDPEWARRLDPERARVMQLLKKVDHDLRE
jgi:dienelactone hydrolase